MSGPLVFSDGYFIKLRLVVVRREGTKAGSGDKDEMKTYIR